MTTPDATNPSFEFGRESGLFAYNIARSLDDAERSDQIVMVLAEDAVRTALRLMPPEGIPADQIDIESATAGVISALEAEFGNMQPD